MTAKTWIIVGIVIACLVVFIFGKETISYFGGARHYANAAVKDNIPPEFEIARLKSMLNRLDSVIEKRRSALVDMQLQAETLEKEIVNRKAKLAAEKAVLQRVAQMLAEKQDSYVIGGITYSFAEVDADAVIKAERFKQDQEMLAIREKTLVQFVPAINESRKMISNAEIERQQLGNAVDQLALRAAQFQTMSRIETGKDASGESLGKAYNDIQKAIGELEHRMEKGERILAMKKAGHDGINYADHSKKRTGLEALQEVLQ